MYALGDWIQRRVAGSPMQFNLRDIPDLRRQFYLTENVEKWREMLSNAKWEELREMVRTEGFNFNLNRRQGNKKADKPAGDEDNASAPSTPQTPTEKSDRV
jgi:hypothetical protein